MLLKNPIERAMPKADTKKQKTKHVLLDTAEELFANKGYEGVSVRDIIERAGARLASVNYYFGSKKGLYFEVILRRAHILSADRLELLNSVNFEELDKEEGLLQIVQAFVEPLLKRSTEGDPGWKSYCQLIAQIAMLRSSHPEILKTEFNPTALEFISAIQRVLPELPKKNAYYAFQFILGTTLYIFTENSRLESLSDGKWHSSDLHSITQEMIKYQVGGLINMDQTK